MYHDFRFAQFIHRLRTAQRMALRKAGLLTCAQATPRSMMINSECSSPWHMIFSPAGIHVSSNLEQHELAASRSRKSFPRLICCGDGYLSFTYRLISAGRTTREGESERERSTWTCMFARPGLLNLQDQQKLFDIDNIR